MPRFACLALLLSLVAIAVIGCSGVGKDSPTSAPNMSGGLTFSTEANSSRVLWGLWNIRFDMADLTATIEPIRNTQLHFNITDMVTPPACNDCLAIHINSFDPVTRIMDIDVTLRNPTNLTGYDVRGILYTNDYGHELRNADDWTGLWNVPGGMDINPFKAFAKNEPNRAFTGHAIHQENYHVYIPLPPNFNQITYAVDASWPANCKEPYEITGFSQEIIYATEGSSGNIQLHVRGWFNDVDMVHLSVPEITGTEFIAFSPITGDTWGTELINETGAPAGEYEALVTANTVGSGDGGPPLYDFVNITITPVSSGGGWALTWGDWGKDISCAPAVDDWGNIYVTGVFQGLVDFDPGPGTDLHPAVGEDAYLCKFDSNGNFHWARTWGGSGSETGYGVALDSSGNIYVCGTFSNEVDFNPGAGTDNHISNGGADIFLSKFNPTGDFQWARTWGGESSDRGYGIASSGSYNVYVVGSFCSTVDFDPGPGTDEHSSLGHDDIFINKFDSNGVYQWAHTWGSVNNDEMALGVDVDTTGNLYVSGKFGDATIDFDPGPGSDSHSSNGWNDIFLSKFSSNGDFQWCRTWGGALYDSGGRCGVDNTGNVYITGYFRETVDFDPGPGIDNHTAHELGYDIFLSRFDENGDFQWARTWGGYGLWEWGIDVAADSMSNVYVTGYFSGPLDFDPTPGVDEHDTNGSNDIFLSKFDSSGGFQWARTWGAEDKDHGVGVTTDNSNDVYLTGFFASTVDFDPGPDVENHTSNGDMEAFLTKLMPDGYW